MAESSSELATAVSSPSPTDLSRLGSHRWGRRETVSEIDNEELDIEKSTEPVGSAALVPMPSVQKIDASKRGGVHIGVVLEKARRRLHYSPEQISRQLGIRPLELNAIEAGLRTPSPELVEQLASFYGVDADRLDPSRRAEREGDMLYLGYAVVNLSTTDGSNGQGLQQIATTMRSIRDLARTFRLSTEGAAELAARLRHASLTRKELPTGE